MRAPPGLRPVDLLCELSGTSTSNTSTVTRPASSLLIGGGYQTNTTTVQIVDTYQNYRSPRASGAPGR
jgi:hypothetical protein